MCDYVQSKAVKLLPVLQPSSFIARKFEHDESDFEVKLSGPKLPVSSKDEYLI